MATKELRKQAEKIFKNEYPNAKLDKFEFGYNLDNDGKLKSINIYYKVTPKYSDWILITDSRFKNNSGFKEDLYGRKVQQIEKKPIMNNISSQRFPKIWLSNGTIQKIPESNI